MMFVTLTFVVTSTKFPTTLRNCGSLIDNRQYYFPTGCSYLGHNLVVEPSVAGGAAKKSL